MSDKYGMIILENKGSPSGTNCTYTHISKCKPFVINSRAKLAHRPRYAAIIKLAHFDPHTTVTYWCGGSVSSKTTVDFKDDTDGRMMCLQCEQSAVDAGQPSSTHIAGHHVCTGKVVAVRDCIKCDVKEMATDI